VLKSDNYKGWYKGGQGSSQDRYCYRADQVDCSSERGDTPVTFFAFEWMNPRLGKNIREINLRGSSDFVNSQDRIIRQNAVMLAAISVVKKRVVKDFPDIR